MKFTIKNLTIAYILTKVKFFLHAVPSDGE